jgi:hypothetical protein
MLGILETATEKKKNYLDVKFQKRNTLLHLFERYGSYESN